MKRDFPFDRLMDRNDDGVPRREDDVILEHTMYALHFHQWSVERACHSLGISKPTMYARLLKWGVDVRAARKEAQR